MRLSGNAHAILLREFVRDAIERLRPSITILTGFSSGAENLNEWLGVTGYLVKIFRKYGGDLRPLRPLAQDIVEPFRDGTSQTFIDWYRAASSLIPRILCVFEDSPTVTRHIDELRLRNLDERVLGDHYREDSIVVEDGADHYDLAEADCMERHVREVVDQLR